MPVNAPPHFERNTDNALLQPCLARRAEVMAQPLRRGGCLRSCSLQCCILALTLAYVSISLWLFEELSNQVNTAPSRPQSHVPLGEPTGTDRLTHQRPGLEHGSIMSTKRVASLSSESVTLYTEQNITSKRMAASSTEGFESRSNEAHKHGNNVSMHDANDNHRSECEPMAKWQTMSFPTCNSLHEINVFASSATLSYFHPRRRARDALRFRRFPRQEQERAFPLSEAFAARMLGHGWFRHAWKVTDRYHGTSVAIKTLR